MRAQVDRERVGLLDPDAVVNAFGYRLDHNVDLMRCARDVHHIIVGTIDEAGDDVSITARHGVVVVRRHTDQLGMPLNGQRVHEFSNQIEMLIMEWRLNMGIATKCKLTSSSR